MKGDLNGVEGENGETNKVTNGVESSTSKSNAGGAARGHGLSNAESAASALEPQSFGTDPASAPDIFVSPSKEMPKSPVSTQPGYTGV